MDICWHYCLGFLEHFQLPFKSWFCLLLLFKDCLKYFLWKKITMLPSQGLKIQGWERVAVFSSSTEVLLLLWRRRRINNLSIICLFTDGTTKIIWTSCELFFFAETINSHFPECEKLRTYKMSINNSHSHFPECEKLRSDNNADQQLELLSLFQHWSWSESLELWKPTGPSQFPSNTCIKMCHNALQCLFNKDLLPRLKMGEMAATLSLTVRSPTSTLQRWAWSWYIYYDEVSVCHEKWSLPNWAPEARSETPVRPCRL